MGRIQRTSSGSTPGDDVKKQCDLSRFKRRKSPYAWRLKKQVTIRMGVDVIPHFKPIAEETGIPYQNPINLYLRDYVEHKRRLDLTWAEGDSGQR